MLDAETLRMLDERYAPVEETARTISKATRAVTKLHHKIDQVLPHNLSNIKKIFRLYLEEDGSIFNINRLLNDGWIVIAISQYTFSKDDIKQEWGNVVVLGKY